MSVAIRINGAELEADPSGALWWPERSTLIVADLHFEKGSSYAPSGRLLPPYDTTETLVRLAAIVARLTPTRIVCLGDSLHDGDAVGRIAADDRARLAALMTGRDWIWIEGNHDPAPHGLGGRVLAEWVEGPLLFRHAARIAAQVSRSKKALPFAAGEISGHYHPRAGVNWRGRTVTGRCFVHDGARLVLPAFGAYTGGLDVGDPAIRSLFPRGFHIDLIGRERLHRFNSRVLFGARDG
ncbi:MAG: ligase-associated DNA damage response endonuclease PdeM [Rhodospirillaceae bacterium]|nr:ligase-associated DNA damage response endonuclease PdeM [Rhodospirillaceae bacterium]